MTAFILVLCCTMRCVDLQSYDNFTLEIFVMLIYNKSQVTLMISFSQLNIYNACRNLQNESISFP